MSDFIDIIQQLLYEYDDSFKQIKLSQTKNASGYDTIVISSDMTAYRPKVEGAMFARIKENGKDPYISFKKKYKYWFDERDVPTYSTQSETNFIRIASLDFWSGINQFSKDFGELAATICLDSMSFPKFGCCSRYKKCSDARKCIHDDLLYSSSCEYRKNLEAGRIFYGINRMDKKTNNSFAVIDVETPNGNNDTICSIGIVVIQDGVITDKEYYLINPESSFDDRCVAIHGITQTDVTNSPIFPDVWKKIEHYFSSKLLVGHNLSFDLSCIKKSFRKYSIEAVPTYYIDTLTLSRDCISDLDNYRLPTMCRYFGIDLDTHHNALCDSLATAKLLLCLLNRCNTDIDRYIKKYSFDDDTKGGGKKAYTNTTKALQELQGVLYGVMSDGELNDSEIYAIERWVAEHYELKGNFPYDKIYSTVEDVLSDGIITDNERNELFSLINSILNPIDDSCSKLNIRVDGSVICLSGEFECMSKSDFAKVLENKGAVIKNSVVKSLDYLIIGGKGSELWAHGNYGSKVKKAMEYNENGGKIEIIKEADIITFVLDE